MKTTQFKIFSITFLLLLLWQSMDTNAQNVMIDAVQWRVTELSFTSSKTYAGKFDDVDMDVIFTHSGGTQLKVPAFWHTGNTWKVRFSPTLTGLWTYTTSCSDNTNTGLHNITGNINCNTYTGNKDIYKHGFVKTMPDARYFMYDDGTPFFYLGDTHWNFPANTFENFKLILNKRVQQGFTVIQSEPLGANYNLRDGITSADFAGFENLDSRFKAIADSGLVHANSQLFFVTVLGYDRSSYPDSYLEKLSRYWVARYAAYPVMWTTAQECDKDYYHYFDSNTNPWKVVFNNIHKYDPYQHPQSAHMENTGYTIASNSVFKLLPGHSWFAVQWAPQKNGQLDFNVAKNFWNSLPVKPAPLYEGHYDHLWTNEFGARQQGWVAYLNGMYGYGYGSADIWLYNSTYDMDQPSVRDGITVSVSDKQTKWDVSMNFPAAYQMGYMHKFFDSIEWWNLTPRFDDAAWFSRDNSWYSLSSIGNDLYVVYFYNNTIQNTGTIKGLANTTYAKQWYNPITGVYAPSTTVSITDGTHVIGNKPDNNDWVLLFRKEVDTQSDGNWNSTATWTGGTIPTGNEIIQIKHNIAIDVDVTAYEIIVYGGKQLTLNTGKTLNTNTFTIQSDAFNGTPPIGPNEYDNTFSDPINATGTYIDNGTTTVTTTNVQQYLGPGRNWYISSPVSTVAKTVLDGISSAVYSYTENTSTWTPITNGNLKVTTGYVATNNGAGGIVTFTGGTLNNGNLSTDATLTSTGNKFNLIGNPYPSYIDWKNIVDNGRTTNLMYGSTIWYRTYGTATYVFDTYNPSTQIGTSLNKYGVPVDGYISPMQAFWVRVATGTTGSVQFTNADRLHHDQSLASNRLRAPGTESQKVLRLQVSNGLNYDETIVVFNSKASNGLDDYDSQKMSNGKESIPEIYTLVGNEKVVINGLNSVETNLALSLGFTTGQANTFTIKATQIKNFDAATKIILRDNLLNIEKELSAGDSTYTFTATEGSTHERFTLLFKLAIPVIITHPTVDVDSTTITTQILSVYVSDRKITVDRNSDAPATISITNGFGQRLAIVETNSTNTQIKKVFAPGVYLVTSTENGQSNVRKVIVP